MVCSSISALRLYRPNLISNNDIIHLMTAQDWAGFILTVLSILGIVGVVLRWILIRYVEQILAELKPNSGSSMKDQVTRLEEKIDNLYTVMLSHLDDHNKYKSEF